MLRRIRGRMQTDTRYTNLIPAGGWGWMDHDGTTYPLVGWGITEDGQITGLYPDAGTDRIQSVETLDDFSDYIGPLVQAGQRTVS